MKREIRHEMIGFGLGVVRARRSGHQQALIGPFVESSAIKEKQRLSVGDIVQYVRDASDEVVKSNNTKSGRGKPLF